MNLIFLFIFLFLSIISNAKSKCRLNNFSPVLDPRECRCNDIIHSPMGRIFNGTTLDSRDLPFVAAIYGVYNEKVMKILEKDRYFFVCTGAIISPSFVLT